jgi:hypothetical protein
MGGISKAGPGVFESAAAVELNTHDAAGLTVDFELARPMRIHAG